MSIKQSLLALLAEEPMYGLKLRSEFEARTGGTWPLNVGQVYTTLGRLERDGLVEALEPDAEGRISYRLTPKGIAEVDQWWLTPVNRDETPRDELVIKLALAVTVPGVDVPHVVQSQRTATMRHLRDLTRLKSKATSGDTGRDLAWQLVIENHIFAAESEVRWLDHVESALARHARTPRTPAAIDVTSADIAPADAGAQRGRTPQSGAPHANRTPPSSTEPTGATR